MKKRLELLSFIAALVMLFGIIASLYSLARAQQTNPQQPPQTQQPPDTETPASQSQQQPGQAQPGQQTPGQAQPGQAPDQAQQPDQKGAKEFVGTVMKQQDKYVFQDSTPVRFTTSIIRTKLRILKRRKCAFTEPWT